jgi:hypothetical protein
VRRTDGRNHEEEENKQCAAQRRREHIFPLPMSKDISTCRIKNHHDTAGVDASYSGRALPARLLGSKAECVQMTYLFED